MFRKLTSSDKKNLYDFLEEDRSFNLFIYGDVENYGFETEFQELWAQIEGDVYIAVLLRYKNFVIVYSKGEFDARWFANKISSYEGVEGVSGREDIIDALKDLVPHKKIREQLLAELGKISDIPEEFLSSGTIRKALPEDADALYVLESQIDEFNDFPSSAKNIRESLSNGKCRTYIIEQDGLIVSSATTTAETDDTVMIIGVCTHPDYRGRGYASFCTAKLSADMLKIGKKPCLFYDNPEAGKIYRKIGYKELGRWDLMVM